MKEVVLRDPSKKPSYWSKPKLFTFLLSSQEGAPRGLGGLGRSPPPDSSPEQEGQEEDGDTESKYFRWVLQGIRLVEAIAENKEAFLRRDEKPANRGELDGAARDSAWQEIAQTFNDKGFTPNLRISNDSETNNAFHKKLSPKWTTYVLLAGTAQTKFKEMRCTLTTALANFRLSGMGDCPDEERMKQSTGVYSSKFQDFVQGNIPALYWYEVLVHLDLLESTSCDMPEHTGFNASSQRQTSKPALKKGSKRKGKDVNLTSLAHAIGKPVMIAKTADEKKLAYHSANAAKARAAMLASQLASQKESELALVQASIADHKKRRAAVPQRLTSKVMRLEAELEAMEKDMSKEAEDPSFSDDGLSGHGSEEALSEVDSDFDAGLDDCFNDTDEGGEGVDDNDSPE